MFVSGKEKTCNLQVLKMQSEKEKTGIQQVSLKDPNSLNINKK